MNCSAAVNMGPVEREVGGEKRVERREEYTRSTGESKISFHKTEKKVVVVLVEETVTTHKTVS